MRKKSHKEQRNIETGRIAQKMKTRQVLLATANAMMLEGKELHIEEVAKEAGVSKATAYRYFSNKDILQQEAFLHKKSEDKEDLFSNSDKDDIKARIEILIKYHYNVLTKNEIEFRLYLSAALKDSVQNKLNYSRAGRRVLLIEEALISLKETKTKTQFNKIVSAISIILGIESITILKDLCGLENKNVLGIWRWMIHKIVFEA